MGKTKAPLTRKRVGRRYVNPSLPDSASESSPSSIQSGPSSFPQPHLGVQSLRTKLPIASTEVDARRRLKNRRKRQNSGDDVTVRRQEDSASSESEQEEEPEEEVVTIAVSELERWQQRVIFHVEDHFSNEQLKRIAEFGRVHSSILQEAKDYVANVEEQMKLQLENERASLREQAEEFVAKTSKENEELRQQVKTLEEQVDGLQKQVDSLEKKVDVLEGEKTQGKQYLDDGEQQRNCEKMQQQQPQLLSECEPPGEEMNANVENNPTNGGHEELGFGSNGGGLCTSDTPKAINGAIDESVPANSPEPKPQRTGIDKDQQPVQRHRDPDHRIANGLSGSSLPSPGTATSEGRTHIHDSCKAPTTAAG